MDKRDDLHRMIRDCKKGLIDRIIVKSVSRFARNTQGLLATIRFLKDIGVSIYFEEQGIDTDKLNSEMIVTFPGMAAQQESESISGNMRWSYKKRMESGDFNCCAPAYGFDLVGGNLVINETEAAVVRRIFSMYLQGYGKQAIANKLNEESVPRRHGIKTWYAFGIDYIKPSSRSSGKRRGHSIISQKTTCSKRKVEDVHSSYDRTNKELKAVEARLRTVQPLIKNIGNYRKLKPVWDSYTKENDKSSFRAKHEAELVIFEAAKSTLLAMQGDEKLPSLKSLQSEQQRLLDEQQRLYDERAKLKKEARMIDTMKANVDDFLKPSAEHDRAQQHSSQRE